MPFAKVLADTSYVPSISATPISNLAKFSPRRNHLFKAANETFLGARKGSISDNFFQTSMTLSKHPSTASPHRTQPVEPLRLLTQALGPYAPELKADFFPCLVRYFTKLIVPEGEILWYNGDIADSFYVLETGILRESCEYVGKVR